MTYYENRAARIRNWFADHEVSRHGQNQEMERLRWGQPQSSLYEIRYTLDRERGTLFVGGDLGHAVYAWHAPDITLQWIADCSLQYFASKCKASEYGYSYEGFSKKKLLRRVEEDHWNLTSKQLRLLRDAPGRKSQFDHWLVRHESEFEWGDLVDLAAAGIVVAQRCQAHLIGLKMATQESLPRAPEQERQEMLDVYNTEANLQ